MALEGQLSDFNLAEILQLLAGQQKSGFLNLEGKREMAFVFANGYLISTRDRRSRTRDPLEAYLQAYGFFSNEEWDHINYVEAHSSLDLTEILMSEGLLNEIELTRALQGLAQEMTVAGMRLKRGRYKFNPTNDTPPGVKWKLKLDVQGLLMEAARRMDEEPLLNDYFSSPAVSFCQGEKPVSAQELSDTSSRIMELALAGLSLGNIIRQGQSESFVVRDLLKTWCEVGALHILEPVEDEDSPADSRQQDRKKWNKNSLRSTPLTMLVLMGLGLLGWLRWTALPAANHDFGTELRQRQLRDEVVQAAQLYRYSHGNWPQSLQEMVKTGELDQHLTETLSQLGWKYKTTADKKSFTLG